ncbi:Protein serine/threonine phosphatase PrpC, regulation of stationary phase [Minicystis rosea]|nr:Protein serine/threonine phosphatase PrpC, regulation of stationary phase [Minicystis rosea]
MCASENLVCASQLLDDVCRLRFAGATDQGLRRKSNEDCHGLFPAESLFVLADGMGGAAAGEIAARMAVELTHDAFVGAGVPSSRGAGRSALTRLVGAVEQANHGVYWASRGSQALRGMGTTLAALAACGPRAALVHVGDSRIYRLRGCRLEQLTEDHSLFNEFVRAGYADPDRPEDFPHRNVITRSLGTHPTVEVEARLVDVEIGDTFLLCSDGLCGVLAHDELEEVLIAHADLDEAVKQLVACANDQGGPDNITAVLVRWEQALSPASCDGAAARRDAA